MGLAMSTRRELTEQLARRYRRASRKEKGVILDEFVETTGYQRKYAIQLLNWWGRSRLLRSDGKLVKLVVGRPRRAMRRARPRRYDQQVLKALKQIWYVFDFMCGKRLVVVLRTMLPTLESFGEIQVSAEVRAKLLTISAATIDRLLARERDRLRLKGRSRTKPGSLLKHQIPIRTFADWDEQEPGFFEIDLVAHDGGDASGDFCQTLTITDVDTGWVDLRGLKNKAQRWTHAALDCARRELPIPRSRASTPTTAVSSSIIICCATAPISASPSPVGARIVRTTPVTSSRRTATWCGGRSAICVTTATKNWPPSTRCTENAEAAGSPLIGGRLASADGGRA